MLTLNIFYTLLYRFYCKLWTFNCRLGYNEKASINWKLKVKFKQLINLASALVSFFTKCKYWHLIFLNLDINNFLKRFICSQLINVLIRRYLFPHSLECFWNLRLTPHNHRFGKIIVKHIFSSLINWPRCSDSFISKYYEKWNSIIPSEEKVALKKAICFKENWFWHI